MQEEYYLKLVKKIIHTINIDFANTLTGARWTLSTSSPKVTADIERTLRDMVGDRTAPILAVSLPAQQTISTPLVDVDVSASDDVQLHKVEFEIGGYSYSAALTDLKTYHDMDFFPLDIGNNTLTIIAKDLYGRATTKTYNIFRTRGPSVAINAEFVIARTVDNIRSGPRVSASVIKKCRKGEVYPILDFAGGWFKVRVDEKTVGWTHLTNGIVRWTGALATIGTEEPSAPAVYPPLLSIGEISFGDESADGFLDAGEGGTLTFRIINDGKQVKYRLIGNATVPTQDVELIISALDQPTQSPAPPVTFRVKTRGRWSDVDLDIPRARQPNPDGVAVIIGNRDYNDPGIYPVEYALTDAEAMKKYVLQALGYKEENVIYLQNSSYSDLRSIFGTESDPQGRLHNLIFPDRSDVFIYYSGHGVPGLEDQRGYLLPANVKAEDAQKNGYSLDLLGRNLAQLPAKSVTLVVDACFSGQSEEGLLIRDASPVYIEVTDPFVKITNGSSFFASMGKEIASWFPEQKHGLFTYYFLKGLRGEADKNADKKVTVAELEEYISETVPYKVRRLTGRSQHPVITATQKDRILARY
ncbi:hypothetical protein ES703_17536 [subsurface metagenome]